MDSATATTSGMATPPHDPAVEKEEVNNSSNPHWLHIARALVCAKNAVLCDSEGNPKGALEFYQMAVKLLEDVGLSRMVTAEEAASLGTKANAYKERARVLAKMLDETTPPSSTVGVDDVGLLLGIPTTAAPSAPPGDTLHRSFWLMRVLEKTMRTGGFITPRVYVPQGVWLASGVNLTGLNAKYQGCHMVLQYLQKFVNCNIEDDNEVKRLDFELSEFCDVLDKVQHDLSKTMRFIPTISLVGSSSASQTNTARTSHKAKRGTNFARIKNMLFKETLEDSDKYVSVLADVMREGLVMETWFDYFTAADEAKYKRLVEQLRRVAEFFFTVLCAFVVRDCNLLLKKYMKKKAVQMFRVE